MQQERTLRNSLSIHHCTSSFSNISNSHDHLFSWISLKLKVFSSQVALLSTQDLFLIVSVNVLSSQTSTPVILLTCSQMVVAWPTPIKARSTFSRSMNVTTTQNSSGKHHFSRSASKKVPHYFRFREKECIHGWSFRLSSHSPSLSKALGVDFTLLTSTTPLLLIRFLF